MTATPANVTDDGRTVVIACDTADLLATVLETAAMRRAGRVVIWTLDGKERARFEPQTAAEGKTR